MKDLSDFCPEFQEAAAYYASLNTPSDQAVLVEFLRETQDIFGCITNDAKLEQKLQIRQGEVTSDGTYLLRTQKCFKQCGQGPNMKVGDKMYHHVTAELIDQLF